MQVPLELKRDLRECPVVLGTGTSALGPVTSHEYSTALGSEEFGGQINALRGSAWSVIPLMGVGHVQVSQQNIRS